MSLFILYIYIYVCINITFFLQYICEEHFQRLAGKSIFTGLIAKTHFGRPNFVKLLQAVSGKHKKVEIVLVILYKFGLLINGSESHLLC